MSHVTSSQRHTVTPSHHHIVAMPHHPRTSVTSIFAHGMLQLAEFAQHNFRRVEAALKQPHDTPHTTYIHTYTRYSKSNIVKVLSVLSPGVLLRCGCLASHERSSDSCRQPFRTDRRCTLARALQNHQLAACFLCGYFFIVVVVPRCCKLLFFFQSICGGSYKFFILVCSVVVSVSQSHCGNVYLFLFLWAFA